MLERRPSAQRGVANLGWLNSRHSFSFGSYYDPQQSGFSDLLVINDDQVSPGRGFDTHGHRDMEIFSSVYQDVRVYAGLFDGTEQQRFTLPDHRFAYLQIARGALTVNGERLSAGDGAPLRQVRELDFSQGDDAEVLLFDLRPHEVPQY